MDNEIHLFLGSGCITTESKTTYQVGDRHPILLYLKQPKNSEFDETKANKLVNESGLNQIEFSKAGVLDISKVTDKNKEYYDSAMRVGSTLIIYSDPIV